MADTTPHDAAAQRQAPPAAPTGDAPPITPTPPDAGAGIDPLDFLASLEVPAADEAKPTSEAEVKPDPEAEAVPGW